jgi:mTERF domain-containing protein, mitochondrial
MRLGCSRKQDEGFDGNGDDNLYNGKFCRLNPLGEEEDETSIMAQVSEESISELIDDDVAQSIVSKSPISLQDLMLLTKTNTNIAYFYLQNEIGIPEDDMWRITQEAGSVLGMTANNLRRKVQLLKQLMDLTDDEIRTMIIRQPAILHLSATQNLAPTILFLQRSLDLSRNDLRDILVPLPSILGYSLSNLKSKLNFYLKLCRFTKDDARKLFVSEPKLLTAGVKTGLIPHMHFFVNEIKLPLESLRHIIQKTPKMLLYSVAKNLRPKIQNYLMETLGMDLSSVHTLLEKYPQFINYNLENHILPITRYFVQELKYSHREFSRILLKFPRLVTWSLYKIKHVVGYLRFELGMDAVQTKRVLYQAPQLINLRTEETLKPRIDYLRDVFQLTDPELRQLIAGMPTLTICSEETNIKPKIEFLEKSLGKLGLKRAVLLQPTLLGYSLEKRIQPRMQQILESKVPPISITVGIPMKESSFNQWLDGRKLKFNDNSRLDDTEVIDEIASQDGRIVHWSRPRKPPSAESKEIS